MFGFGINSLYSNTTASRSIAIGYSTLSLSTIGEKNIAIGDSSLLNNTIGLIYFLSNEISFVLYMSVFALCGFCKVHVRVF